MRLLHRLDGHSDDTIYRRYADVIAARGDFLALMFAAPFVDDATFDDYLARAISEMRCGTKDVSEVMDAYVQGLVNDNAMRQAIQEVQIKMADSVADGAISADSAADFMKILLGGDVNSASGGPVALRSMPAVPAATRPTRQ